jgi:N-acetylglucosamine-6-phosphate deacetylase
MKVIDVHTHGIDGHDTRTTRWENILAIAATHGSLGVAEIVPTIYPAAIGVMRKHMAVVRKAMEHQNDGAGTQCRIIGVHLEGPFLNPAQCGALNATAFLGPTESHLMELIEGFEDIVKIITVAPELDGAARIIKKIAGKGIIPPMGQSAATYSEAQIGFNAGARGITHIFNAMRSFHHREPGIAGFGLLNQDVYIEVIADPYHLHRATIDLIFKVKNHARIIIVSDSVRESGKSIRTRGVTNSRGTLMGGCMSITEAAAGLIGTGFDEKIIKKCIRQNPAKYLSS